MAVIKRLYQNQGRTYTACLLILVLFFSVLSTGCESRPKTDERTVVCSIFPIYDWTRILLSGADDISVRLLVDNGADLHSYQASADDIIEIVACGLLIFVGGESDTWITEAAENHERSSAGTLALLECLGSSALTEEPLPGMQEESGEGLPGSDDGEESDEHVWLSLKNSCFFVELIRDRLTELYPEYSTLISENADSYLEELTALDEEFRSVLTASRAPLVIADRFPFAYLAKDYGLTCYAAFSGCSAESEASFETIAFLADKVDTLGLSAIYVLDGSDGALAETVLKTAESGTGCRVLTLESMQSVTLSQAESGVTYLSLMEKNLEVLRAGQ